VGVASSGKSFITNFVEISQLVRKCKRYTHAHHGDFISLSVRSPLSFIEEGMFDVKGNRSSTVNCGGSQQEENVRHILEQTAETTR
jgi:hypothetical protein